LHIGRALLWVGRGNVACIDQDAVGFNPSRVAGLAQLGQVGRRGAGQVKVTDLQRVDSALGDPSGQIEQAGRDVSVLPASRRDFGIVFQSYALFPNLTAAKNVAYGLENARVSRAEIRTRVRELLEMVGLPEQGDKYPAQLSGGQQQRVAIARALITQPSIILADEPTGNLDTRTSIEVMGIFQRLNIERGITIILITHEMDIAEYGTRLVRFRDGKIQVDQKIAKRRDAAVELAALPPPEPDLQNVVGDPVPAEHLGGVS
jgi:ABC-type methionine transport system ATPase subunit